MPAGRPFGTFKFESVEELDACIEDYFSDCEAKPVLDKDGKQITDKNGNPMFFPSKPPTVTGLGLALNISPQTLCNYSDENYAGGKYLESIKRARLRCLDYKESRLYDKDGVNGAKFDLINNSERMGGLRYADRQEINLDIAPITFVDDLGED